ncbi:carbon monoxide dehydrogenase subunit G [Kibdelosporangium banguiense]|uniref:Carbon monoxide dehydrogenase subunit G n=1 Tax=Kibdelosporangium banguiense TaxID=1365924 RepID=A0ABS4TTZ9_9PSEU|nr:SRPBCC domain-containing protein [Kibdelosporangium banguiense]MBP2327870.1 carbon monoxide dehydrogenase subunit G [Kibdelosporangium banguiense]
MKLTGRFETSTGATALLALQGGPDVLTAVPSLSSVRTDGAGNVRAIFTPRCTFIPMPFSITVAVQQARAAGAVLSVHGTRGPTAVDILLRLEFTQSPHGTSVSWTADVAVRGPGATVGQRVVRDLVSAALDEVLRDTAAVA